MTPPAKLKGVNLGGWLVLEKWLTESLFEGTNAWDEHGFMQIKGAAGKIEHHRKTFITEKDFAWLHQNGLNAVRIPVGYWLFEATDGYTPTVKYLDQAMEWAQKYDIKVLIDLHAAPGSQNGGHHSGKGGRAEWFEDRTYQDQTIELLRKIAKRYHKSPALWGIELLNEPATQGRYWTLIKFYRRAYRELRALARPGTYIVFHDGFRPLLFTGTLWRRKSHPIVMDVHWYAFTIGRYQQLDHYLRYSAVIRRLLLWFLQLWQPVIIGEWSTVLPQNLFDVVPKSEHNELLRQNTVMQQRLFIPAKGQFYWNYKAEGRGMWHFRSLIEDEVIKP